MGEIADDMINGRCCSWCGVYFEQEHGYPVACKECWKEAILEENRAGRYHLEEIINGVQKAIHKEL